jgi:glycosyltransferase involved in cell wall biosynthesis
VSAQADICLIVEGGYPYVLGGVASWMDAYMRASPELRFHVISIGTAAQPRVNRYPIAANVVGITDVILDRCPTGRSPSLRSRGLRSRGSIAPAVRLMQQILAGVPGPSFAALIELVQQTGFGQAALLDSKPAWTAMEAVYRQMLPNGPLLDFFWSWRFLARGLLSLITTPLPPARIFHAVSTGYAGLFGAYAQHVTGRPYVVTEHGIYTNERRIELAVARWIHDSGASGFGVGARPPELRDIWLAAFTSISRIAYEHADAITTQYRANQHYQCLDGAPPDKLRIIPNGIDVDAYDGVRRDPAPHPPTVLMIGRIVPIKDIRTFIMAVAQLRELVPEIIAILIGPEDEDPAYAADCRALVEQLGIAASVRFLGRVPDVKPYLGAADVLALTSISEAQPIALLEAAATGLPAVTTDVGSCREIIEGFADDPIIGRGGFVVEPCNPKAVAEALAAILRDDALRAEMGQVMRRRIPSLYHKNRVKGLYDALYTEVAASVNQAQAKPAYRAPAATGQADAPRDRVAPLHGPIREGALAMTGDGG